MATSQKRRNFLKGTGACMALGAIKLNAGVGNGIGLNTPTKEVLNASHWGAYWAEVKDDKVVGVRAFEKDFRPSATIRALPDSVYNPSRVKYPYVREGFLKHGHKSDTSKRGKEKFIRVSWDKAIELVTNELKRVYKEKGKDSIFAGCYGWRSAGNLHHARNVSQRLLKITGGYVRDENTYSTGAIRVIMPYVVGDASSYNKPSCWDTTIEHASNIVFFGSDPCVCSDIAIGVAGHEFYRYIEPLKKRQKEGKLKIYNINPLYTETAQTLQAKQIFINPNTDVALMLGIANYLYKNKLYDEKFMKSYTYGRKEFFKYLTGEEDGIDKTPSWASKITNIKEETITNLAKSFVSGKTMLIAGWSLQRADHGEQPHWMLVTLACMLGYIGQAGGGFDFASHYASNGAPIATAPGLSYFGGKFKYEDKMPWVKQPLKFIPVARIADMLLSPGQTHEYNGLTLTYPEIELIWWAGGNPFHHHQDVSKLTKAWQKAKTVINIEPNWTATSKMADIILPANTSLERNDISFFGQSSHEGMIAMKKVVDSIGESKSDFEICSMIAEKMDVLKEFAEDKDEMGWIEQMYNESLSQAKQRNIKMPPFKEFWESGFVEFEVSEEAKKYVAYENFIKDKRKYRLGTPSGKFEIFSKKIEGYKYDDCKPHPTWFEPIEYLGSKKAKTYPFHIVSPHPKYRLHSQLNNTWLRHVYEVNQREPILINTEDAKKKGIQNGDVVRVFNDRGEVLAGAVVTDGIAKNVVAISQGAWYDPLMLKNGKTMCVHGHVNTLTKDKGTSKLAQGNIAHTALVDFEKYKGELPQIKAFMPPKLG